MARWRSKQVETQSIGERHLRRNAVTRFHIIKRAVGPDELAPGAVQHKHLGHEAIREQNVHPTLVPREYLVFDQEDTPVVVSESGDFPCWVGGRPQIIVQVNQDFPPSADVVVDVFHNGVVFGTITLETPATQVVAVFNKIFHPFDRARVACTDAGADAQELVIYWRLA